MNETKDKDKNKNMDLPSTFVCMAKPSIQERLKSIDDSYSSSHSWMMSQDMTPRTPTKHSKPPISEFGGLCYDEIDNRWTFCYQVEIDGTIHEKGNYFHNVRDAHHGDEIELAKVSISFQIFIEHQ